MRKGKPIRDLTGKVFGMLTVVRLAGRTKHGGALWLCRCGCGVEKEMPGGYLTSGDTTSCGCYRRERKHGLLGHRFGRLTVIAYVPPSGTRSGARWLCRCDCGQEKEASARTLRSGHARSCGCLRLETITKHGKSRTPEWYSWSCMISRCYYERDKDYHRYGGRGIRVCDRWKDSFSAFLTDLGQKPSAEHCLDRINTNGNYEPGNVRWATSKEQGRNRRNNRLITIDGETKTIAEWAEVSGVKYPTIHARLMAGWPPERLLERMV